MPRLLSPICSSRTRSLFVLFCICFIGSCDKENTDSEEAEGNVPPSTFDLVFINDNAQDVVLSPYLTWTPSTDSDGGTITYQVLLDPTAELTAAGQTEPSTVIGEDISTNGWIMTQGLAEAVQYSWRVVAFDGQGGSTKSTSVRTFTTAESGVINNPPGDFDMISPADGETDVPLSPTLTWQAAIDPDGDPVFYDVYLYDENLVGGKISSLNPNTSTIPLSLNYETEYNWEVYAYDNNGAVTESESIFDFTTIEEPTPAVMTLVTSNSPLQSDGRSGHQALVHNGLLYVIGGFVLDGMDAGDFNDVWTTSDLVNWTQVRAHDSEDLSGPHPSDQSQVVSYNGLLYVFNGERNTIQTSVDGAVWEHVQWEGSVLEGTHYGPVQGHQVVVYQNALFLIGGSSGGQVSNDVWKSVDGGINWEEISDGSFPARRDHQVVATDDGLYLMGGAGGGVRMNDVWHSEDGATWEFIGNAPWLPRASLQCTTDPSGTIYMVGGDVAGDNDEIWVFDIFGEWSQQSIDPGFSARESHQVFDFLDGIYIYGGKNGVIQLNDIWLFE